MPRLDLTAQEAYPRYLQELLAQRARLVMDRYDAYARGAITI